MNIQKESEREQLKAFGVKLAESWRRGLLKSPLVRIKDGKKVVDVQAWLDRVNGGMPPDVLVVELGINGTFGCTAETLEEHVRDSQIGAAAKLVAHLRACMPNAIIGLCTEPISCGQDGFAENYGCKQSEMQYRKNMFHFNRELAKWVSVQDDAKLVLVPFGHAIDPVFGYIREPTRANAACDETVVRFKNALHPSLAGGRQLGDALAAWLCSVWAKAR